MLDFGLVDQTASVSADIQLISRSAEQVVPEAASFTVGNLVGFDTTDLRDKTISWSFNDTDDYQFQNLTSLTGGELAANSQRGMVGTHIWRTAQTSVITAFIVENASGKSALASYTFTTGAIDTVYTDANAYFVSPTSDWADAPAGIPTGHRVTSIVAALQAVDGQTANKSRILLNRGETHQFTGYSVNGGPFPSTIIMSNSGAGARATMDVVGALDYNCYNTFTDRFNRDLKFYDIGFTGSWDSTTETDSVSGGDSTPTFLNMLSGPPKQTLIDNCTMDGVGAPYSSNVFADSAFSYATAIYNDSLFTNHKVYQMLFDDGTLAAVIGCRMESSPQSRNGGSGADGVGNSTAGVRTSRGEYFVVKNSEFMPRHGWTNVGSRASVQPALRGAHDGELTYSGAQCKMDIADNFFDCVGAAFSSVKASGGTSNQPIYALMEGNYSIGSYGCEQHFDMQVAGVTVRNNIFVYPAMDRSIASQANPSHFIRFRDDGTPTNGAAQTDPIRVYNNTFIDLHATGDWVFSSPSLSTVTAPAAFTDVVEENNVVHRPNYSGGDQDIGDAPIDSAALFVSGQLGAKQGSETTFLAGTATPIDAAWTGAPQAGSAALGGATTGLIAHEDFNRITRPSTKDRGAVQASAGRHARGWGW